MARSFYFDHERAVESVAGYTVGLVSSESFLEERGRYLEFHLYSPKALKKYEFDNGAKPIHREGWKDDVWVPGSLLNFRIDENDAISRYDPKTVADYVMAVATFEDWDRKNSLWTSGNSCDPDGLYKKPGDEEVYFSWNFHENALKYGAEMLARKIHDLFTEGIPLEHQAAIIATDVFSAKGFEKDYSAPQILEEYQNIHEKRASFYDEYFGGFKKPYAEVCRKRVEMASKTKESDFENALDKLVREETLRSFCNMMFSRKIGRLEHNSQALYYM